MKTEPERKNCVGFVHTKTERVYADTKELELIQTEPLGILPYNLLIQNATIKNKVVLEFDDRNRQEDTIRNVWDKIKNRVGV